MNEQEPIRVRLPRGKQVLGIIEEMLGGSRFRVHCKDGKTRLCRIPGASRRGMWIRVNNIVIIEPWDIEPDEKGDIIWCYTRSQADNLRRRGFLKDL